MEKNYSLEMLEGKIPSSIYALLMSDDPMNLPDCSEEDWDKAHEYLCPDIPTGWQITDEREFSELEQMATESCIVVPSQFGLSMRFNFAEGEPTCIPCSSTHAFKEGEEWYIGDLKLLFLSRFGEKQTICRVAPIWQKVKIATFPDIHEDEYMFRTSAWSKIAPVRWAQLKRQGKKIDVFRYLKLY